MQRTAEDLAVTCAHVTDERKGEDITVLKVGEVSSLADYFVIVTGRNERHLKALRSALTERLEEVGANILGTEGEPESGWILLDADEVIVHLFSSDKRELYDLEMLWGDCPALDWAGREPLTAAGE